MEGSTSIAWKGFKKRDGTEVPFSFDKIVNAVHKALVSCGCKKDNGTAKQVAFGVINELADRRGSHYVPYVEFVTLEAMQETILQVLKDKGLHTVAAAFKSYSEQRDMVRKTLAVKKAKSSKKTDTTDKSLLLVESAEDPHTSTWDRKKVEEKLRQQTHLKKEEIEIIAKLVENRIVASGMRFLTSSFIRELVNVTLEERQHKAHVKDMDVFPVSADFVDSLMDSKSVENSNITNNNPEAVSLAVSEYVLKEWALSRIFSREIKQAHLTGAVHLHDLGFPHRNYCGAHSLEYLKKYGLVGLETLSTESAPAKSASVLTGHLNTFLASMQANYAGALGIGFLNIMYAPLLKNLSGEQIYQIAQELIFTTSQCSFSRGGQTLFTDFNIFTGVPRYLKNVPAIGPGGKYMAEVAGIAGEFVPLEERKQDALSPNGHPLIELWYQNQKLMSESVVSRNIVQTFEQVPNMRVLTYGDYEEEVQQFAIAILEVVKKGDKNGRIFPFPKIDLNIDPDTFTDSGRYVVYQKACEVASHNGSVYFVLNRDAVQLSACCRLRQSITDQELVQHPERMAFCGFQNVTINIPQSAYRAARKGKKNLEGIKEELNWGMEIAIQAHLQKKEKVSWMMAERGRPLWQVGKPAAHGKPYIDLDKVTYIVGLIGVNDAVKFLTGKEFHEDPASLDLGLEIVAHMYLYLKKRGKELNMKLSLEESPAESTARRLAKTDLSLFPESRGIVKAEDENAYYTNSIHLAADAPVCLVDRIREQSKFHLMIESGAIIHAFVGENSPQKEVIGSMVKRVFEETQCAQVTISPEFTYCNSCKKNCAGLVEPCPSCGSSDVDGMTRVVGYFSKVQNWNKSKRDGELPDRHGGDYAMVCQAD